MKARNASLGADMDIAERLRYAHMRLSNVGENAERLMHEAADEIERLRAENSELKVRLSVGSTVSNDLLQDAADETERLREALKECADELADQVEGHYAQTKDHPAMKRRYDRDMAPVLAARALLGE